MKRIRLIGCIVTLFLILPSIGFAIDFIWKDKQGSRYYDCGGHVVGGRAKVKKHSDGLYRVKSALINRMIRATSIYHAAQIACGVRPEFEYQPQTKTEE